MNQTAECETKRVFGYVTLFSIAVVNLFLSFQDLRSIWFSLAGFNSFFSRYRFILVVILLQKLTIFFLQINLLLLRLWA